MKHPPLPSPSSLGADAAPPPPATTWLEPGRPMTMELMIEPTFEYEPSNLSGTIITVPAGVTEKDALLSFYADAFNFPEYFGYNWDALHECLLDLGDWHPEGQTFSIIHQDIPLISSEHDVSAYISILHFVLAEPGSLIKHVVFRPTDSEIVQSSLVRFLKNEI